MSAGYLALGIGCERDAEAAALQNLVTITLETYGLAAADIAVIASLDARAEEQALRALRATMKIPLRCYSAAALLAETDRLANPSATVFRAVGCYGVAEGAALAAAGPAAALIVPKQIGNGVTCAIAGYAA
jgi:cobalamin biosynthesis protein CbiG